MEDYLFNGIYQNLRKCFTAQSINKEIIAYASEINSNGYGSFFFLVQCAFATDDAVEIAKLFDNSKQKTYSTRSLPRAIKHIRDNLNSFTLHEKKVIYDFLTAKGYTLPFLESCSDETLISKFIDHHSSEMEDKSSSIYKNIEKIKIYRDKRVAHNEVVDNP